MNCRKGFTLIELAIAASILSMVALAVLSVFGAGLRTFDRVEVFGSSQAGSLLFLQKLEMDVRNAFELPGVPFSCNAQKMSFAGVTSQLNEDNEVFVALVKRSYYFDNARNVLFNKEEGYPQAATSLDVWSEQVPSLTDVRFRYYAYTKTIEEGKEDIQYGWQDAWSEEGTLPRGVKIVLTFNNGDQDVIWERTVLIPTGGDIPFLQATEEEEEGEGEA